MKVLRQFFHLIFIFLGFSTAVFSKSLFDLASPVFMPVDTGGHDIYTYQMTQSSSGLMWFGGSRGVFTYDGYEYKYLDYPGVEGEPFPSVSVRDLKADSSGIIWAATHKQGLIQINEKTRSFKKIYPIENGQRLTAEESFRHIIVVDTSGLWLAGDNGVDYYDIQKNTITRYPIQESLRSPVQVIANAYEGKLLVGTSAGLLVFDPASGTYSLPPYKGDLTLNKKRISEIVVDKLERIWIGTFHSGAFLYRPDGTLQQLGNYQRVVSIVQLNNEIWLGTKNYGVAVFDIEKAEFIREYAGGDFTPLALGDKYIANLFVSRSGLVWVSAWGGRVWMVPPSRDFFRYLLYSPLEQRPSFKDDISSITEMENGDIWISSLTKGVDIYDPERGFVKTITTKENSELSLPSNNLRFVKRTKDRSIWIGTSDKGLYRYTVDSVNGEEKWDSVMCRVVDFKDSEVKAFRMFQRSNGELFFHTFSGLFRLIKNSGSVVVK